MLGRMNFNARVDIGLEQGESYTIPSKGYLWILSVGVGQDTQGGAYINGGLIAPGPTTVYAFVPVSAGDVLSSVRTSGRYNIRVQGFFVPQI